jgi:alpha-L-fucosidase
MKMKSSIAIFLALAGAASAAAPQTADPYANETAEQRAARMEWWHEAKFGMFIHWGIYAVPAGTYKGEKIKGIGEWIMRRAQIPVADYQAYAKQFNPVKYNPKDWAKLAHDAGMRYMVITSKHHDGFTLFPSKASKWNVVDATPYGKDLIGPLADAARAEGLKFGLYYSQAQDWYNPGGAKAGMKEGQGWDPAHKGSFDKYLETVAAPQVREILTRYKPAVLWWDTPTWMTPERAEPLEALLALRPGIITNNRLGGGYRGDTDTPEQHIPATGIKGRDWETCMTMNSTWGYKSYDDNWKPTEMLIRNLVDIVSKGGNYLLNVGPTAEGLIPQPSIERLRAVGKWMDVNGEAIYGTTASVFPKLPWGRCTTKRHGDTTTLYLHVFDWPADGKLIVPGLENKVLSAKLLDGGKALKFQPNGEEIIVAVPGHAPDAISSTVVLEIKGAPKVQPFVVRQSPDGTLKLTATNTNPLEGTLRYEGQKNKRCIGFWTDPKDAVVWTVKVTKPGTFAMKMTAAGGGTHLRVEGGAKPVKISTKGTGGYETFKTVKVGEIKLAPGKHTIRLVPDPSKWTPINFRSLVLEPVK